MKEKDKAFSNGRHNAIRLTFPNGNSISTIWGWGSYSENGRRRVAEPFEPGKMTEVFTQFQDSENVEIMILSAPKKLETKIKKKYGFDDASVAGHINITQWLEILNLLAK